MMKKAATGRAIGGRPVPAPASHDIKQDRGDQHRGGDRDAVGRGEMARRAKAENEADQESISAQFTTGT